MSQTAYKVQGAEQERRSGEGNVCRYIHGCPGCTEGNLQRMINPVECQRCCKASPQLTVTMEIRCWREDNNNNDDNNDNR